MNPEAKALIDFWFAGCNENADLIKSRVGTWFSTNPDFDNELATRFGKIATRALAGELNAWGETPGGALALVLALDQLPRNCYRNQAKAYAGDAAALAESTRAVERGFDEKLAPIEVMFLYLPFEHAESLAAQERCIALFERLAGRADDSHSGLPGLYDGFTDYARRHHAIIERFGRFPHRNAVLGRTPTPEEIAWLDAGGDTFGG